MLGETVITHDEIQRAVTVLAREIDADLEGRDPVFICVLKGAVYFFTALTQRIKHPVVVDFIQASSYGATTESSGTVTLIKDVTVDIAGKDVYVVEDIVDTGLTLADVVALLAGAAPPLRAGRRAALQAVAPQGPGEARFRRLRDRGPVRGRLRP